jgi:hypothetical protein
MQAPEAIGTVVALFGAAGGQENELLTFDAVEWLIGRRGDRFLVSRQ